MNFGFTDEQELLRSEVRKFLDDNCPVEEVRKISESSEGFSRELWKQINPGRPFPGVAVLQVDRKVPALVVKSVFQTAALAGYPSISFMVGRLGGEGGAE